MKSKHLLNFFLICLLLSFSIEISSIGCDFNQIDNVPSDETFLEIVCW